MRIDTHRLVHDDGTPIDFRASGNHGGPLRPRFLVMHYTAGRSADASVRWLCSPNAKASAHVVIGKDGKITQLVPFNVVAWHAGASAWKDGTRKLTGMNKHSIGIELDNPGKLVRQGAVFRSLFLGTEYAESDVIVATHKHQTEPAGWHVYPTAQLEAAFEVASLLVEQYGLKDVVGHEDIAPKRKSDPGPAFPMDSFRTRLLGRQ
jgi:N-acetylmuramoyl-L-alanine amidase